MAAARKTKETVNSGSETKSGNKTDSDAKSRSETEAVVKLFQGEAEPVEQSQEMIEVAHEYGMPADEHRELADALRNLGVVVGDEIPSIRSIEVVDD